MLQLYLKNWGPAEASAFCPRLFVSPKHSNGFRLSSLQILVSKFDGTFHIHDSHSSNNCWHIPESHQSLNSKPCCDDDPMILPFSEWSSIFHPKRSPGPPCLAWFCPAASKLKHCTFLSLFLSEAILGLLHFSVRLKDLWPTTPKRMCCSFLPSIMTLNDWS